MNDIDRTLRIVAVDLDDTIVGDAAAEQRFRTTWESLETGRRPLLVYNAGRGIADVQWLVLEKRIPVPEFIIGGIGTELHDPLDAQATGDFEGHISPGWDREVALSVVDEISGAQLQPSEFLNRHKLSWHWPCASRAEIFRLEVRLREAGLDVSVSYTAGIFLDVIPRRAGKGNALAWLCRRAGVPLELVLVAGASGNNGSMVTLPGVHVILVANVSRDLLAALGRTESFISVEKNADGVLAGLDHFGVLHTTAEHADLPSFGVAR